MIVFSAEEERTAESGPAVAGSAAPVSRALELVAETDAYHVDDWEGGLMTKPTARACWASARESIHPIIIDREMPRRMFPMRGYCFVAIMQLPCSKQAKEG